MNIFEKLKKLKKSIIKKIDIGSDIIRIDTLIGKRTSIEGNVTIIGNGKIDGSIIGPVKASGDLVIGEDAKITGDVSAGNLVVAGVVVGNINAKGQLSIKQTANVRGEHTAFSLIADEGSVFVGNCNIIENEESKDENEQKTLS
ncbi:MAG: Polymer-forming cytoskeletal [Firmicutes bacterium ADurb.Bin193]|nr:MAG: Polymer-forming cytoskeletal [Firmicutes bacterium ADurb.Bin193]